MIFVIDSIISILKKDNVVSEASHYGDSPNLNDLLGNIENTIVAFIFVVLNYEWKQIQK